MNPKYLLLDACVIAAYYLPESATRYSYLGTRANSLIDAIKTGHLGAKKLLIPSICVPEVFSIFAKYRFGEWNHHVNKTIDDTVYWKARLSFRNDIHNGKHIQQFELSRYHIFATDLISPVDHHYEYYRNRNNKSKRKIPMGAFDHTIIGMGIELVKSRGAEDVLIITSDRRLGHILDKARSVPEKIAAQLGLVRTAKDLGLKYGAAIYPQVVNLATARDSELKEKLGDWPLNISGGRSPSLSLTRLTKSQRDELKRTYKRVTEKTSESVVYTDEFEIIYEAFLSKTGLDVDRNTVAVSLSNLRKRGMLPKKGKVSKR